MVLICNNISWCCIDNCVYIVDETDWSILKLEDAAARFWILIAETGLVEDVIKKIVEEYHVERCVVEKDIHDYIFSMQKKGYYII